MTKHYDNYSNSFDKKQLEDLDPLKLAVSVVAITAIVVAIIHQFIVAL